MYTVEEQNISNEQKILEAIRITTAAQKFIKGKELAAVVGMTDPRNIHPYIRNLRAEGEMIAATSDGYYIASGVDEYKEYIKSVYAKRAIKHLINARDSIKKSYEKYGPIKQLQLDLFIEEVIEEIRKETK